MSDVTRILERAQAGDPQAADELLPLVYDELRRLAAAKMAHAHRTIGQIAIARFARLTLASLLLLGEVPFYFCSSLAAIFFEGDARHSGLVLYFTPNIQLFITCRAQAAGDQC